MSFFKKTILTIAVASAVVSTTSIAHAQKTEQAVPGADLVKESPRKGWFWYQDPVKEKVSEPVQEPDPEPKVMQPVQVKPTAPIVVVSSPKKEEDKATIANDDPEKCLTKEKWSAECGFVDPGADFDFQAKQRDILLQQMSLRPDSPEAVEAAQRYMKWIVGKAAQAANMWYFNMIQNPDLDPTVKNPISEIGIALASTVKSTNRLEYFRAIREQGGVLFYFSRADCAYCHDQAPFTKRVARTMGLQVINVPLDGKCIEGFEGNDCAPDIPIEQIAVLDVKTVPTLFLHVPDNTWIRLGTGVVTDQKILAHTVNFFSAYRAALLAGIDNGKGARPSVTFDPSINANPTGTAPADGSSQAGAPDRAKLLDLMGYAKK